MSARLGNWWIYIDKRYFESILLIWGFGMDVVYNDSPQASLI